MESQGVRCFSGECRSRAGYIGGLRRLAAYLRRERIDILHTHLFDPSVVGLLAGLLAGTPTRVMTRHYSDYHTRDDKFWHTQLDKLCTRLSHAVIAVSQHTADHMVQDEGAPANKIHVVLNGIDFERVKLSDPEAPQRVRAEFEAMDKYLVLIVARLHPEKGHTYLFQALQQLRGQLDKPVLLLVAGQGPFEQAYRDEVRALGIDDMVRFVGFRRDVPDLMAAADIVLLPSVAEAFGLVLTEALYVGTPVIATQVGGIPEIIEDGRDGLLVPPADSAALAAAIRDLLLDPLRRRSMAGSGKAKVAQSFRYEDMVRAYENVYAGLTKTGADKRVYA